MMHQFGFGCVESQSEVYFKFKFTTFPWMTQAKLGEENEEGHVRQYVFLVREYSHRWEGNDMQV